MGTRLLCSRTDTCLTITYQNQEHGIQVRWHLYMCRPEACDFGVRAGWGLDEATVFFPAYGTAPNQPMGDPLPYRDVSSHQ
jgi:hypothetical protein